MADYRPTDWDTIDLDRLLHLRKGFLEGSAGTADYWQSPDDLEAYDRTFGQRIAWKWDYVLDELEALGYAPPAGTVLDWGCGSGVASRRFLSRQAPAAVSRLQLHDRSALAMRFAARQVAAQWPDLPISTAPQAAPADILLVSHVLTELSPAQTDALVALAAQASAVLWVEPGTFQASRALLAVRERLRGHLGVVAPCTHCGPCGLLADANTRHWCHFFAPTPTEVFMDGGWARFARAAGIDLRSLPVSYLALDKRPIAGPPADAVRILGQARTYKAYALLLGCDRSGVHDRRLMKRTDPAAFHALRKGRCASLCRCRLAGHDIAELHPAPTPPEPAPDRPAHGPRP